MLEDPWCDLMASRKLKTNLVDAGQDKTDGDGDSSLSESLIAQVSSLFDERAPHKCLAINRA